MAESKSGGMLSDINRCSEFYPKIGGRKIKRLVVDSEYGVAALRHNNPATAAAFSITARSIRRLIEIGLGAKTYNRGAMRDSAPAMILDTVVSN
jgi:hypothetical protein